MAQLHKLAPYLQPILIEAEPEPEPVKRGPKPSGAAQSPAQRQAKKRATSRKERETNIAVLDFETDPFDNVTKETVYPFAACLYADSFEPIIIWEENFSLFVEKVLAAIEALPGKYTIYAHNGGKFDYMFLLYRLRGPISFKGRGIMVAKIGNHELRDSFHIIPEKLSAYKKDEFDYQLNLKSQRNIPANRAKIIEYMRNDCRYTLDIIKTFIKENGLKISIGQAAMAKMREAGYKVDKISSGMDKRLRRYFFGGRVECIKGPGVFEGDYKLYDVNSMYPKAMADFEHPIGNEYIWRAWPFSKPGKHTVFLDIECHNYGAFVARGEEGETTAAVPYGVFHTTIWEYQTALRLGLIKVVRIHSVVDCYKRSNFKEFVYPLYDRRLSITKPAMKRLKSEGKEETQEYNDIKKDDMITKFLLNNGFGKYAQDPRRYKEHYITAYGEKPDDEKWFDYLTEEEKAAGKDQLPKHDHEQLGYAIWERPNPRHNFNNVGTAASITGAARAILMEAIHNAIQPIYCDTDSLICLGLEGVEIHPEKLGAWDLEDEFKRVVIAGKKLYACDKGAEYQDKILAKLIEANKTATKKQSLNALRKDAEKMRYKIRSKGTAGLTFDDLEMMVKDGVDKYVKSVTNLGPTLTKTGAQVYITRRVRATAKPANPHLKLKHDGATA